MQLIKEPIILAPARLNLKGSCDILLCVVHADAGPLLISNKLILFFELVTTAIQIMFGFFVFINFDIQGAAHSKAGGGTDKGTNKPSSLL